MRWKYGGTGSTLSWAATLARAGRFLGLIAAVVAGSSVRAQQLNPWTYESTSSGGDYFMTWDRHRYGEDPANTVFALPFDFAPDVQNQVFGHPDILVCNFAHFWPPEGAPAAPGTRRVVRGSVERIGVQLYVNYSGAMIDPTQPSNNPFLNWYREGTFFISTDTTLTVNDQPIPSTPAPVPTAITNYGLNAMTISATRAAMGVVGNYPGVKMLPTTPPTAPAPALPNGAKYAVYVTAGVGYGDADFDPIDLPLVHELQKDRLWVYYGAPSYWVDESYLVPASALDGNSSGVAFADFNNDGYMDLFVGKSGNNYNGEKNVLCLWDNNLQQYVDASSGVLFDRPGLPPIPEPAAATVDVAAADLDGDGDLDIVVANRMKRGGPTGPEARDYFLINQGQGTFMGYPLVEKYAGIDQFMDTRSVAVGDIDKNGLPEIVFGNAGTDGVENSIEIPATSDHPIQVWKNAAAPGATPSFVNMVNVPGLNAIDPGAELYVSAPLTEQVVLVDAFSPVNSLIPGSQKFQPDGWLDLVIVNHRDILRAQKTIGTTVNQIAASSVFILVNRGPIVPSGMPAPWFEYAAAFATFWGRTVAIANFMQTHNSSFTVDPSKNWVDFFAGGGNRFGGVQPKLMENLGTPQGPGGAYPWGSADFSYDRLPGTEHGYGFTFGDINGNGILDAIQTSRSYDYLVWDVGSQAGWWHRDLLVAQPTGPSPKAMSNARGRMSPKGAEDAALGDFNGDGMLDAVVVGQVWPSESDPYHQSTPDPFDATWPETTILEQTSLGFVHDHQPITVNGAEQRLIDKKIDPNGRVGNAWPFIGDRVVANDFDNDKDIDIIVKLFPIQKPGDPAGVTPYPVVSAANGFSALPNQSLESSYAFGWRYLKNVRTDAGTPAGTWFKDVAAQQMTDGVTGFKGTWNRSLGSLIAADFDNNGFMDIYDTVGIDGFAKIDGAYGPSKASGWEFEVMEQMTDKLFLNAVDGKPVGTLVDKSSYLPRYSPDVVDEDGTGTADEPHDIAGSFGLAHGDLDNDGDTDVVVTHNGVQSRSNHPWLLINQLDQPDKKMLNVFNMGIAPYSIDWPSVVACTAIHRTPAFDPNGTMLDPATPIEASNFVAIFDIDGDGDQDIVLTPESNVPRILKNMGQDTNGDGLIRANDAAPSQLGAFVDATDSMIGFIKPTSAVNDAEVADLNGDGVLDLALDPFNDQPQLWINRRTVSDEPLIADVWPRGGWRQAEWIDVYGANLDQVDKVELRFKAQTWTAQGANLQLDTSKHLRIKLPPTSIPITGGPRFGLAQMRAHRNVPGGQVGGYWTKQYFGYFVLKG